MMRSGKMNHPVMDNPFRYAVNSDFENLLPDEQNDAVYALFEALPERAHSDRSRFAYPEDHEKADFVDEQALHRIVEDLQFGQDLRLNF